MGNYSENQMHGKDLCTLIVPYIVLDQTNFAIAGYVSRF